jgi:hypothetical protein
VYICFDSTSPSPTETETETETETGTETDSITLSNSSFTNLCSIDAYSPAVCVYNAGGNVNILDCLFRNLSSTRAYVFSGAIFSNTSFFGSGTYNYSGNEFWDIRTNRSVLLLNGSFISFSLSYNSFFNVSSVKEGGDFFFY